MRNFKRILLAASVILLILAVLVFMLENQQSVSLLFLGWAGPELPVSLVMILAILFGMLIGPAFCWIKGLKPRVSSKRMV